MRMPGSLRDAMIMCTQAGILLAKYCIVDFYDVVVHDHLVIVEHEEEIVNRILNKGSHFLTYLGIEERVVFLKVPQAVEHAEAVSLGTTLRGEEHR